MKTKWLENNRFLWWFAGEDPYILSECEKEIKIKFSIIGLLVVIILLFSGLSISYGVYELLESYYIGVIIGIYFAILVLFLYLFILYTLTKDVLPPKTKSKYGRYSSRAIRIGFLIFLGVLVSQPIEYELFSYIINSELNDKIVEEIESRNNTINNEYVLKINELKDLNISENILATEIDRFKIEKTERLNNYADYQYSKNFFVRKLILMDSSPTTRFIWVLSLIFIVLFVTPVYLKLIIGLDSNYYITKKRIEYKIVLDHHEQFVHSFNETIKVKYKDFELKWNSIYTDPPFNTTKKTDLDLKLDNEFSKWLLNESY